MARIYTYEDAYDNTRWVVERSGFKGEDRKEFDTYAAAKAYQDCLQAIEDREKLLNQNERIIANQERLFKEQERQNSHSKTTQFTRQILDPEYKEWIQYQKETDPNYKRWKVEKERKRIQLENEWKAKEILFQREKDQKYFKDCLHDFRKIKVILFEGISIYDNVLKIYLSLLNLNFKESRKLEYETGYADKYGGYETYNFKLSGGQVVFSSEEVEDLKRTIATIDGYHIGTFNIDELEGTLSKMVDNFQRMSFDTELKKVYGLLSALDHFFGVVYSAAYSAARKFDCYKLASTNGWHDPEPKGFFDKRRVKSIITDYLYDNKSLIETLIRKTKELEIVRRVGIFINSDFESSRHYSYGYKVQR